MQRIQYKILSLTYKSLHYNKPGADPDNPIGGGHIFFSGGMYFVWTNEGAKRPRIEGEARTEGEARDIAGGGVWGGGSVSPSPENF